MAKQKTVKEIAASRMTRAIKAIAAVGGLNKNKLNKTQCDACINGLKKAVDACDTMIRRSAAKGETLFTLPD